MPEPAVLFERLQPIPPAHPRPWFPTLPVIGRSGSADAPFPVASRFLDDDALVVPSGKVATYWALRGAGVGAGDRVAVPAYHCPTMIYPIVALRARPLFMPVGAGLEITAAVVAQALREPVKEKIQAILDDLMHNQTDPGHPENVRSLISEMIESRLNQLTPIMVKDLVHRMIHKHLGWLVIWGAVTGGMMGILAHLLGA